MGWGFGEQTREDTGVPEEGVHSRHREDGNRTG